MRIPTMRCGVLGAVALGVLLAGAATAAAQEDGDLEIGMNLDLSSKYVWRGIDTVDDWVLQPSVDLSLRGFALNVWGNLDLTDENDDEGEFSEVDVTASYTFSLESVELTAGAITYFFPSAGGDTTELFASLGLDVPLSPSLTVYRDVDEVDGTYVAFSTGYALDGLLGLGESLGLKPELEVSIGYGDRDHNEAYYGERDDGFADLTLGLVVPFRPTESATVSGWVRYSTLLDGGIRDRMDRADNLWFGFSVSVSF
jgi:uncharacterized protein (TIGR02001 family)